MRKVVAAAERIRVCAGAARARQQVLAARRAARAGPPHSERRRRQYRHAQAIQRVYFNIGSCSEQCWVNHT